MASTTKSIVQLHLPASIDQTAPFYILVQIRDTLDCITEVNVSSVMVYPDFSAMEHFVEDLQEGNGSSEMIGQMIQSIAKVFNEMNEQNVQMAFLSKIFFIEMIEKNSFCFRWNATQSYFDNIA